MMNGVPFFKNQPKSLASSSNGKKGCLAPGTKRHDVGGTVIDYRFVGIGARVMFRIMTGNAYIDAQLQFEDLNDGKVFGEQAYNTRSSAKQDNFSPVTPKQVYTIADEVI